MRRCTRSLLSAALLSGVALYPTHGQAQTPAASMPSNSASDGGWQLNRPLLAIGAGAIVGAVAFNLLAAPLGTVPLAGGLLEAVPYNVALGSRLILVTGAGAGAVAGDWLYSRWAGTAANTNYLLTLGAGALAGVAVGNYLSAGAVGYVPYYVGAGATNAAEAMASSAAQAASRVYVIGSAVLGAWVGDYFYRR